MKNKINKSFNQDSKKETSTDLNALSTKKTQKAHTKGTKQKNNMSDEEVEKRMIEDSENTNKDNEKPNHNYNQKDVMNCIRGNEDGDAALFIRENTNLFLYDITVEQWLYWNDNHWRIDIANNVFHEGINKVKLVYENEIPNQFELLEKYKGNQDLSDKYKSNIEKLNKRLYAISTHKRKVNVLKLSSHGTESLYVSGDKWDKKPHLLAFKNCVIDLNTGEEVESNPKDYIKTSIKFKYNKKAKCKKWKKFLFEVFNGDKELVNFVKRLLGYALSGKVTHHIYPIFWGENGRNGKTTFFEILKWLLGDFICKIPSEFIMDSKFKKNAESPDAMLLSLQGKRIAWISETGKNDTLNVPKIKELSGGDTIVGRPPYGKQTIQFKPTHTLFTVTNRRPRIPSGDNAIWKRTILIPFLLSFVVDPKEKWERKVNHNLMSELQEEGEGILNWIVEGYQDFEQFGMDVPDIIIEQTKEYRKSEDIIGQFIEETCSTVDPDAFTTGKDLRNAYHQWCEDNGYKPLGTKNFTSEMKKRKDIKYSTKMNTRGFLGIFIMLNTDSAQVYKCT